jgi:glycosyl transferase family 25
VLQVFYINLDRDVDRRAAIEAQLQRCGLLGQRFAAVDGANVRRELLGYFAHSDGTPPLMSPGEIGCYASHLGVWREITRANHRAALVLEDDAVLPADLAQLIDDVMERAPTGWDFIHMCGKPDRAVRPLVALECGRELVRYSRVPPTTAGYLISASGAHKMLNQSIKRVWPVDWDTRMPWVFQMETYGVMPAPVQQDKASFKSSISHNRRGRSRLRTGLPRPTAYSWTNNPLRTPTSFLFNMRRLGPAWWLRCFSLNFVIKLGYLLRPLRRQD